MPGTLFVGLDVGTTTSKAVVFTEAGDSVASGRATTPWTVTDSGAELDPTALLDAAKSAVAQALADCPPGPRRRPRRRQPCRVGSAARPTWRVGGAGHRVA